MRPFFTRWLKATALAVLALIPFPLAATAPKPVLLATTTSTQDSGLLDVLIPQFLRETGWTVKTIAVGSGQALAMGQKGEVDVLLVHSPDAEKKFMAAGAGFRRRLVMHNDFVIVGPPADPARVKAARDAPEALARVAGAGQPWISRADNSGTHAQELKLWKAAGLLPQGQKWYLETGLGMGQTLNVAAEKKAYTLADRATWLALRQILGLDILCQGDPTLRNIYHVLELDPARFPKVNAGGAKAFADFLVSKSAQETIHRFGVKKFGGPLFFPDAGNQAD